MNHILPRLFWFDFDNKSNMTAPSSSSSNFVILSVRLLLHKYVESVRKYILWHYWHGLVADPHGNANGRCCEHHRCQRFIIIFILIQIVYVVVTGSQDRNFVLCSMKKNPQKIKETREKKWKNLQVEKKDWIFTISFKRTPTDLLTFV